MIHYPGDCPERKQIMSSSPELLVEKKDGVARWTLNRPEKRNALSRQLLADLAAAQKGLSGDPTIRAVVLSARGSVFCSGHDLGEMVGCTGEAYRDIFELCEEIMLGFRRLAQPVIARVQGTATAAGCQLVAACDLAVAADTAAFATPGVKIGLFCTTPMVPLVRAIAPRAALEMLLTGRPISAKRACELGLVNRVVTAGELDAVVEEWLSAICASSAQVVCLGKKAFYDQLALPEPDAYTKATRVMIENAQCPDAQEGIQAFLAKRPPRWPSE
jgi:enoyl-CoA hydratase/carnithine racemase